MSTACAQHTCTQLCAQVFTHPHTIHLYMCIHTLTNNICTHAYPHKHMGIHTLTHPYLQTRTHTQSYTIHAHVHTQCPQAHMHDHTHANARELMLMGIHIFTNSVLPMAIHGSRYILHSLTYSHTHNLIWICTHTSTHTTADHCEVEIQNIAVRFLFRI